MLRKLRLRQKKWFSYKKNKQKRVVPFSYVDVSHTIRDQNTSNNQAQDYSYVKPTKPTHSQIKDL